MKKYGLQLRIPPGQQKPAATKPTLRPPSAFGDDDEDDVEREISRQASKNKALQKIEEQHKKALEEDPSVFDYDGVYDEMKEKIARPKIQDRAERKSKYIETLMRKAKEREVEHEITYERKLLKERSKDDHLHADKEKFVTSAYRKKLAEQAKWLEEEKLRQIREEKEDVTKKSDLSDFYFGLNKNVAFGAQLEERAKPNKQDRANNSTHETEGRLSETKGLVQSTRDREEASTQDSQPETSRRSENHSEQAAVVTAPEVPTTHATTEEDTKADQALPAHAAEHYKRSEDALAAARERYLARKRAREQ
ncbi:nuclear speckle splicing regulatory protein 1-like [Phoenix dactylifera]|uniref:Nuclear speckle splicing regulatory protein 1-like n=1 Tax=Phoenix dactylifera TaxID=42345 RepID=A0A8B7CI21_PHODC|nr:nuclear speckle splicing regulatory protein 1-like [Phoenix dactylifera]